MDINLRFESGNKKIEVGKDKSYRLLKVEGIESSNNELYTTDNVYGDGSRVNARKIKAKPIMIEAEYSRSDKEYERRKLISFFNLYNKGKLIIVIGNVEKAINYEVESFSANLENVNNPLTFLVSLYCPDPFFNDLVEKKQEIAVWKGSFSFPLEIAHEGIEFGYREPSLIVNVFNGGDVETGMKIVFRAKATLINPSLFNVETREYFKVLTTMQNGDVITINTNRFNKKVELRRSGVVSNIFNLINFQSTFLQLKIGDNLFRYDAESGLDNLEVDIYYNPKIGGV